MTRLRFVRQQNVTAPIALYHTARFLTWENTRSLWLHAIPISACLVLTSTGRDRPLAALIYFVGIGA